MKTFTTWWAEARVLVDPIEQEIRDVADRIDAGECSVDEEAQLEARLVALRAGRREILDGDEEMYPIPTAAELREDILFDAEYDVAEFARPKQRAAHLRAQLDDELEQERRERAAQVQRSGDSFDVDEAQIARHREALATSSWREIAAFARHEAGHVVAGLLTEARGGPRLRGARFLYGPGSHVSGAQTEFENGISSLACAAGAAANRVLGFTDQQATLSPSDRANLEQAGVRSIQHQQQLVESATALLAPHVDAVQRVADVLFRDGVISAADARALLAGKVLRRTPAGDPSEHPIPWGRSAPSWQEAAW